MISILHLEGTREYGGHLKNSPTRTGPKYLFGGKSTEEHEDISSARFAGGLKNISIITQFHSASIPSKAPMIRPPRSKTRFCPTKAQLVDLFLRNKPAFRYGTFFSVVWDLHLADISHNFKLGDFWPSGHSELLCDTYDDLLNEFDLLMKHRHSIHRRGCFEEGVVQLVQTRVLRESVLVRSASPSERGALEMLRDQTGHDVLILTKRFDVTLPLLPPLRPESPARKVVLRVESVIYPDVSSQPVYFCSLVCKGDSKDSIAHLDAYFEPGAPFAGANRGCMSKLFYYLSAHEPSVFSDVSDGIETSHSSSAQMDQCPVEFLGTGLREFAGIETSRFFGPQPTDDVDETQVNEPSHNSDVDAMELSRVEVMRVMWRSRLSE